MVRAQRRPDRAHSRWGVGGLALVPRPGPPSRGGIRLDRGRALGRGPAGAGGLRHPTDVLPILRGPTGRGPTSSPDDPSPLPLTPFPDGAQLPSSCFCTLAPRSGSTDRQYSTALSRTRGSTPLLRWPTIFVMMC